MQKKDGQKTERIALQKENARLRRAVEELSILNDLARTISGSLNSEEIMRNIIHRSLRAVQAEQGDITLVDQKEPGTMKTLIRTMVSSSAHQPFHLNQNLLGWMQINRKSLRLADPRNDPRFKGVKWDETIRSVLCTPLMVKSALIGILTIYNKKGSKSFTAEDERLLSIIAGQSAQVVENARLYEEEKALMRMQDELRVAYDIQVNLLPKDVPPFAGYDIAGKSIPAQNVGGDYFDFISMDADRLVICLGDITGKGVPAALLMANLQATIRSQTLTSDSCCDCITRANKLLYQSTDPNKFATLFYGILDKKHHQLCYCNAGHNFPLLFSNGQEPLELQKGGVMIGILENVPFEQDKISLKPGDMLIVYSDGITEALNNHDEEFGEGRLIKVIREYRKESSANLINRIVQAVRDFAGRTPQSDDITLLVIRREK